MTSKRQWASSAMGQSYRRWLAGEIGPDGQQMALPGMPQPPEHPVYRLFPFLLVTLANKDGRLAPGWPYLARVAGLTTGSVRRHVARMVADGWLVVESKGHRGHRAEYRLTIPAWAEKGVHQMNPNPKSDRGERGSWESPKGVHLVNPLQSEVLGNGVDHSLPPTPSGEERPQAMPDWVAQAVAEASDGR